MKAKKLMAVIGAGAGLSVAIASYLIDKKKRQGTARQSKAANRKHSHIRKSH